MPTGKKSTTSKVTIKHFGLQANTDRTVFATWSWSKSNTKEYSYQWDYTTGDGVWFEGERSTTTSKQSTYNAKSNATKVRFRAKPISTTHRVNGKNVSHWTGDWCTYKEYSFLFHYHKRESILREGDSLDKIEKKYKKEFYTKFCTTHIANQKKEKTPSEPLTDLCANKISSIGSRKKGDINVSI